jgi:predicted Rossmann fold flavoprotein
MHQSAHRNGPDVVVIGAGAAGTMATIFAARAGARAVLLERTRDGGRKILISGGGRCNILPSRMTPSQYVTASSPNTLRRMLFSWPLDEQRSFFETELGMPLDLEPETGKLFPRSNRARDVRDTLLAVARRAGARLSFGARVIDVVREGEGWLVTLEDGAGIRADTVVVASGGLSVPATGSDGFGLTLARRLGHTVHDTYPALTPLTATPPPHAHLAGVSLDVRLTAPLTKGRATTQGGFLFTHRGYSGPAVLDISHHAVRARMEQRQQDIRVRWTELDADGWDTLLRDAASGTVGSLLRRHLPARLADTLLAEGDVHDDQSLATLRRAQRRVLVTLLAEYPLPWTGDEGYRKAEVTGGGIALGEVDPHTLESRLHPGLFWCGEVLDAFGPIGGYNFLWAWATGRAAGIGAAARATQTAQTGDG